MDNKIIELTEKDFNFMHVFGKIELVVSTLGKNTPEELKQQILKSQEDSKKLEKSQKPLFEAQQELNCIAMGLEVEKLNEYDILALQKNIKFVMENIRKTFQILNEDSENKK